ncbi:hypothetical protein Halhy_2591 [Haliscomenobacter hydrossis DSM 1100]|uniref:Uncharacterized protein n=1 Tax=Haliscomenobacter hydrossis (strain ATCC 27775 / DSM 1100 / LMG 10767 / O) TaxID=760192 RepID=F4KZM5_HALH1|nr:hypothetical protein Halhy_2591 [Haliscomenobacter hydrossis DSM 1100]
MFGSEKMNTYFCPTTKVLVQNTFTPLSFAIGQPQPERQALSVLSRMINPQKIILLFLSIFNWVIQQV